MAENYLIRQAGKGDAPALIELIAELAAYEGLESEAKASSETLEEWMFGKGKAKALLALLDGKAIGYALYFYNFSTFTGKAGVYLEDIYIKPEARGRGYGKKLFLRVAQIASEEGCGRLEWACLDWNRPSIDFYLSMGATPMQDWTVYRLSEEQLAQYKGIQR
jgi:GNAT superfamily N-acetyltransferase